jgi:hypothetical protein
VRQIQVEALRRMRELMEKEGLSGDTLVQVALTAVTKTA